MRPYIFDLHEDIAYYYANHGAGLGVPKDFGLDIKGRHVDIPKFKRARVKLVFASVAPLSTTIDAVRSERLGRLYQQKRQVTVSTMKASGGLTFEQIKIYYNLARMHPQDLRIVETREDLDSLLHSRKTGLLMALEGSDPLEDVGDLEVLFKLGIRSLHLTWNFDNRYSASCMSEKDYGLTGDGEALVERANELGVIMDMAHASRNASMQLLEMTKLPPIFSHANSMKVKEHVRNVDDEEIAMLKKKGGVMGFDLISSTIGPDPSVKSLADHVMHVFHKFGPDVLALGSDFLGTNPLPKGLEDVTKVQSLWKELAGRGMSAVDVEKMAYKNALRVIEKNASRWNAART